MQFSALSTAFRLAEQSSLYLTLGQTLGLTVVRKEDKQATCEQVFKRVANALASSLHHAYEQQSLDSCLALRAALNQYTKKNKASSWPIAKQVDALFNLVLLKAASEDKTAALSIKFTKADAACPALNGVQYANCLISALKDITAYYNVESENKKLLPKRVFYTVQNQAIEYLADKMGNQSIKLLDLQLAFFDAMSDWWQTKAAMRSESIKSQNTEKPEHGEYLLATTIPNPTSHDFDTLVYPRDLLFIEKQTLFHLIGLSTTELFLARKVLALLKKGYEASYEQATPSVWTIMFSPREVDAAAFTLTELSLFLQTKKACGKIAAAGVTEFTKPVIKKLLDYEKEPSSNKEFFNLCIEMLTINELFHKENLLRAEWQKYDCAGAALTHREQPMHFESKSYAIKKRLKFLWTVGSVLHADLRSTEITDDVFEERHSSAVYFTKLLRQFSPKFVREEDTILYERLSKKIAEFREASSQKMQLFLNYQQTAFENNTTGKEYAWNHTTIEDYRNLLDLVDQVKEGIAVRMPFLLRKLAEGEPQTAPARDFTKDLSPPKPSSKRQIKRKKAPSSSRSPSPPTLGDSVAEVTKSIAKLVIAQTPVQKELDKTVVVKKASKQLRTQNQIPPAPQVARIQVIYAKRVTDWFCQPGSKRDPFMWDPNYTAKNYTEADKLLIRIKHSFAQAVDKYLPEGLPTTDKEVLNLYNAKKRIQIPGEITIDSPILKRTIKGIFTYTFGQKGDLFHRGFASKSGKEIMHPDAQKGWDILDEAQPVVELPNEKAEAVAWDGSYVVSETDNLVVIRNDKDGTTIRLARF